MPVISGSCCGTVWYCTPAGPVEVAVGTAPPAGFTGGPWATAAEASACPVPDIVILGCDGACSLTIPGVLWITIRNVTGSLSGLPNSIRVPMTVSGSSVSGRGQIDNNLGCGPLKFHITLACSQGTPNRWAITVVVENFFLQGCNCYTTAVTPGSGWTDAGSINAIGFGAYKYLACNTAYRPSNEFVENGVVSPCSGVGGGFSFDMVLSE